MPHLSRVRCVGLLLATSVALVALGRAPWVRVVTSGAVRDDTLAVRGTDAAPGVSAAALVALAAAATLTIAGPRARQAVLIVAAAAGGLAAYAAGLVLLDPAGATTGVLAERTVHEVAAETTPVVWAGIAVAAVMAATALASVIPSRGWGGRQRFERGAVAGPAERTGDSSVTDIAHDWDALTRGEDPTR